MSQHQELYAKPENDKLEQVIAYIYVRSLVSNDGDKLHKDTRGIPKTKMHQNLRLKRWKLASISNRTKVNVYDTIVVSVSSVKHWNKSVGVGVKITRWSCCQRIEMGKLRRIAGFFQNCKIRNDVNQTVNMVKEKHSVKNTEEQNEMVWPCDIWTTRIYHSEHFELWHRMSREQKKAAKDLDGQCKTAIRYHYI